MTTYAPIALFVYKRLDLTRQALECLKKNHLAASSSLYIFSDAAKSPADEAQVKEVRQYLACLSGFKDVRIIATEKNQGCAASVISGVSRLLAQHDRVIVVEDDLAVTDNYLDYANAALDFYADKPRVFAIGGWGMALDFPQHDKADVYYLPRTCSWGWATWKDRWERIDWNVSDYGAFRADKAARKRFNLGGGDLSRMLDLQMSGRIDSWAIRWCYAQYRAGMLTVHPKVSKVDNTGFGKGATHTVNNPNFTVVLDESAKRTFDFGDTVEIDEDLLKQFTYYFSYRYKIKNRLRNYVRAMSAIIVGTALV